MKQLLWTVFYGVVAIGSLAISSGCSSSSSSAAAKPGSTGPVVDASELGQFCSGGTSDGDSVAFPGDDTCKAGICLADATDPAKFNAYCSADCSNAQCPTGYICKQTTIDPSYDCFIDPNAAPADGGS
jgi:hypothetical protein